MLLAAACMSRAREESKPSLPSVGESSAASAAPQVELVPTRACPARELTGLPLAQPGCAIRQTVLVDLDHDGARDCVRWTRCGPAEPSSLADGGVAYPRDVIEAVRAGSGESWTLYGNERTRNAERVDELAVLRFANDDERLLTRVVGYGSGNVQLWTILDITAGAPRRWTEPPLQDALARLLAPRERIGKQRGPGVEVNGRQLEASWLVYRRGDPGCCPSGGVIKAQLVPGGDGLRVQRVWREPAR
jgi:hypothetical protein